MQAGSKRDKTHHSTMAASTLQPRMTPKCTLPCHCRGALAWKSVQVLPCQHMREDAEDTVIVGPS